MPRAQTLKYPKKKSKGRDELLIDLSESTHQRSHSFTDLRPSGVGDVSGQLRGSLSSLCDPASPAFPEYGNIDPRGEGKQCTYMNLTNSSPAIPANLATSSHWSPGQHRKYSSRIPNQLHNQLQEPLSQGFEEQNKFRQPFRQAPPPPGAAVDAGETSNNDSDFSDDWEDAQSMSQGNYTTENSQDVGAQYQNTVSPGNQYYTNVTEDPFDTSHIRCYDEPPAETYQDDQVYDRVVSEASVLQEGTSSQSTSKSASISQANTEMKNRLSSCAPSNSNLTKTTRTSSVSSMGGVEVTQPASSLSIKTGDSLHSASKPSTNLSCSTDLHWQGETLESSAEDRLSAQIGHMWITSIGQPQSMNSVQSHLTPQGTTIPTGKELVPISSSSSPSSSSSAVPPLMVSSSHWSSVQPTSNVHSRYPGTSYHSSKDAAQMTLHMAGATNQPQLALPPALTPAASSALPKLDPSFIAELEKSLGKDQASANTFNNRNKKVNNVSGTSSQPDRQFTTIPALPPCQQSSGRQSSSRQNLNTLPGVRIQEQASTSATATATTVFSAFSDLDVLSSSRTLGLLPQQNIDTSQYFPKNYPVNPNLHQSARSPGGLAQTSYSSQQSGLMAHRLTGELWGPMESNKPTPALSNMNSVTAGIQMNFNWQQKQQYLQQQQQQYLQNQPQQYLQNQNQQLQLQQQHQMGQMGQQVAASSASSTTLPSHSWLGYTPHPHQSCPPPTQEPSSPQGTVLQPTLVLSPQVTVNYNQLQVVCGGGGGGGVNKGARGEALVCRVTAVVPGTSEAAARQALHVASGDYQGAVQYLKVEKLYRLGLVNKEKCKEVLEANSWELERSASALLDLYSGVESQKA